jgi:SAM-dependent methyltransferase
VSEALRETASDDYARRFAGPIGGWFLEEQTRATLALLADLPAGATVLDVGGGHGQLAPVLARTGYQVLVVGSAAEAGHRLAAWVADGQGRYQVADLLALPFADRSFDAVICFRLLAHSVAWPNLIGELCRVSRRLVVLDYPSTRSVNQLADRLFTWKKRIERNTRPFRLFSPTEIREEFARQGYQVVAQRPQFLWPMVLHRAHGSKGLARVLEAPGRHLRVTALLGSPVVVRADRRESVRDEPGARRLRVH